MANAEPWFDPICDGDSPDNGDDGLLARLRDSHWIGCCAVSTAVHLMVVGALALVWWSLPDPASGDMHALLTVDTSLEETVPLRFSELPDVFAVPAVETTTVPSGGAITALQESMSTADELAPANPHSAQAAAATWQNWMAADVSAATELAARRAGAGDGTGAGVGSDGGDAFFGLQPIGRRFVYVLDCSRSMNHPHNTDAKTRFKRMKLELVRSVGSLAPEMEFFLLFFNDFPIAMPASVPVPAVPRVQQQYLQWMSTLKAEGNTEPLTALQIALRLQPDVIYFLTDGSFTYRVEQEILGLPSGRTKIHTFAFDESMTPEMRRAYELLHDNKGARARQSVETKKEFQKVVAAWKAHKFLQNMATRHGGTFRIIPDNG